MANLDILKRFPNQLTEGRETECVGETWADIIGNIIGKACDAGFSYAATLRVMGSSPTTAGSDPQSGGYACVVYGALQTISEPFDALTTSELYEANWANYPVSDKVMALQNVQNGLQTLSSYQAIVDYLSVAKMGVAMHMTWYASFMNPNTDGTLPVPSGTTSDHCIAIYEATPLGLRAKVWLGPTYGQEGYVFITPATFGLIFQGAWGFTGNVSRWWSLVQILIAARWYLWSDISTQL